MSFTLPPLPYATNALAPYISEETLLYHHGKHHQAYVTKLNALIEGTPLLGSSLEQIIRESKGPLFNNAAQVWNHTFYWSCLTPSGGSLPKGDVAKAIESAFGSFEAFKTQFSQACVNQFGSGWAWFVKKANGELAVYSTSNAETPMTSGDKALLTCDVWEHAYYIDTRNDRAKYVDHFWNLVNWDFVRANLVEA